MLLSMRPAGGLCIGGLSILMLALSGCSLSPSINVLGSYFPAWIICCAVGLGVAALAHSCFVRWNLVGELWPLPVLYPSLILFVSCGLWLTFFR
ncbi:MAG TPA: YtcA family lipoprotein [Acidobacteriaceae bacterium]|nr:YtcA family lipoprotein [Acidobacteriaceae bacterium]